MLVVFFNFYLFVLVDLGVWLLYIIWLSLVLFGCLLRLLVCDCVGLCLTAVCVLSDVHVVSGLISGFGFVCLIW